MARGGCRRSRGPRGADEQVYVENMAAAHILAAVQLARGVPDVAGGNSASKTLTRISSRCTTMPGTWGPPWLTLPFWFLFLLVKCAVLAIVIHDVFGAQLLHIEDRPA